VHHELRLFLGICGLVFGGEGGYLFFRLEFQVFAQLARVGVPHLNALVNCNTKDRNADDLMIATIRMITIII
jgi:hypothetical protein